MKAPGDSPLESGPRPAAGAGSAGSATVESPGFPAPLADQVRRLVERHGLGGGAILPVLEAIHDATGSLSNESLRRAGRLLGVRPADLKELALRSGLFSLESPPAHAVVVCVHKNCVRRGAPALLDELRRRTGLVPGQISPGGELSVDTVRCFGACDAGPNVVMDGVCYNALDPPGLRRMLDALGIPRAPR